jgi:hypothetical protein
METTMQPNLIIRDLGDGLILRRTTIEDTEKLAEFNSKIHSDLGPDQPDLRVGVWTRDLMTTSHPTFVPGDFTIVEDTATGKIVSSLNLISQTWSYGGIPFGVGRPELVGTLPEYRNRGLVRAQFDVVHQWSAERGEKLQAITGIPYYYRIFGYEMGLAMHGGRAGFLAHIPILKDGEAEPYCLRPAVEADLPFIADLYEQASHRYLVSCVRDEKIWRYELLGANEMNVNRMELRVIETPSGSPIGYLGHPGFVWGQMMVAMQYEVMPGVSWAAVTPSVIRYLAKVGEAYPPPIGNKEPFQAFGFWLGIEHPVYDVIPDRLPRIRKPYAFYVRVADLPDFIRTIAPVLEKRLATSSIIGYTGEVKITFYRDGLRLAFEQGKLTIAEPYKPHPVGGSGDAGFPDLTFLQLLFGYRSLEELRYAFADCWASNDNVAVLLTTLFPKKTSNVWPLS